VLWHYGLLGFVCLIVGYWVGARHARRIKRKALQELNTNSLELLDKKAEYRSLVTSTQEQDRKDRLQALTLKQLKQSNSRLKQMRQIMISQTKKQYAAESQLRLKAIRSHEKAVKAATIARKATTHLKRMETALPALQTIKAPGPKSYGTGETVTVKIVDQPNRAMPKEIVRSVSNRDSLRLTKLKSSNEVPGRQR